LSGEIGGDVDKEEIEEEVHVIRKTRGKSSQNIDTGHS
jgi:hypothetical protein